MTQSEGADEATILQFGTFDVRNYGDLLFPLIAQWRLRRSGLSIQAVSPTEAATGLTDAAAACAVPTTRPGRLHVSGVLIGGGNIVHTARVRLLDYAAVDLGSTAYPSLWLGATALAALHDVPVAWNAPGVPIPFQAAEASRIRACLNGAEYLSVRDQPSREALAAIGITKGVDVVPDTALDLARMWTKHSLQTDMALFCERKGFSPQSGFYAIHVKARSIYGSLVEMAEQLDGFAEKVGRPLVLVALAGCHGDDVIARRLGMLMRSPHVVLDDPISLKEIAAVIGYSQGYVGSSMHGYVTAWCYDVPTMLVTKPVLAKFDGLLDQLCRRSDAAGSWAEALGRIPCVPRPSSADPKREIEAQLDRHWASVERTFKSPPQKQRQRSAFLNRLVASNLARRGWRDLMDSVTSPS